MLKGVNIWKEIKKKKYLSVYITSSIRISNESECDFGKIHGMYWQFTER